MKERPILFSGEMVRAILEGRKTQTRRPVKPQPTGIWGSGVALPGNILGVRSDAFHVHANVRSERKFLYCPFGQVGDRLWVRETFKAWEDIKGSVKEITYRADGNPPDDFFTWTPSIHMPRWASRITLEITGVRVERIQEISEEDAAAEGARRYDPTAYFTLAQVEAETGFIDDFEYRAGFADLWSHTYGNWSENPWVWVVEFKRVTP